MPLRRTHFWTGISPSQHLCSPSLLLYPLQTSPINRRTFNPDHSQKSRISQKPRTPVFPADCYRQGLCQVPPRGERCISDNVLEVLCLLPKLAKQAKQGTGAGDGKGRGQITKPEESYAQDLGLSIRVGHTAWHMSPGP